MLESRQMLSAALALSVISAAGAMLTAWRIYASGLGRKYRIFLCFLLFWVFCTVGQLTFNNQESQIYLKFWVITQIASLAFYVGVVVELMGLILSRHRGFYTAGRWAMSGGILISVIISAASLLPRITPEMPQPTRVLGYCFAAERALDFSLATFLLLMLALLNFYAVPLSRNVLVHAVVVTVFFVSSSLDVFLRSLFGLKHTAVTDTIQMSVNCACMLGWLLLLSAKGEKARVKASWYAPEKEQRILSHLDSLNATLLKMSQK